MPILNHDLKTGCDKLFDESRWPVLTMLILHANVRNRCWPGMDRLAKCTGKSLSTIEKAKQWLMDAGAITLVPYKERIGKEKKLPQRQHVYQLTGQITINGKTTNYLYVADDNGDEEKDSVDVTAARTSTPVDVTAARTSSDCNQSNPDNPASVSSSATPVIGIPLTGVAVTPPENSQLDNPPAIDHPSLLQQFPTVILPPSESSGDSPPKVALKGSPPLPEPSGFITARDLFKRWPDDGYVYRHTKTGRTVIGVEDKGDDLFEIKLNGASFGELTSPEKGDVSITYISRALEEQRQQALKELPPRNLPATGVKTHSTLPELPSAPSGALQAAKPTVKVATGLASTPPALPHVPPKTVVAVDEPPVEPPVVKASRKIPAHIQLLDKWFAGATKDGKPPVPLKYNAFVRDAIEFARGGATPDEMTCAGTLVHAYLALPVLTSLPAEVSAIIALMRLSYQMCKDGIVAADVTAFVKARYAELDFNGKPRLSPGTKLQFRYVAQDIATWKAAQTKESTDDKPILGRVAKRPLTAKDYGW